MLQKLPRLFLHLLVALLAINLLQAHFTELIFDEAYYWYYSQNIAWGYFDHPPMVAWMIKLSSFFFDGELGVRFMSCLLSVATPIVLWNLIDHPKKKEYVIHFFVVIFSMPLLNAWGFFTLPDTPLLFFTALFLWVYKKFIAAPSLWLALLMGLVMAALMYSKYHAILVILFVLLSNLKLLTNKFAWVAVFVALFAYLPHFNWLYEHDFVSIKYHLFERPNQAYKLGKFTGSFFLNLIVLFGLTFPIAYYILLKTKPSDKFTKALLYLTYGFIIFFFISSFSKRVQTQWLIVICIPISLLIFNQIIQNKNLRKWVYGLGITTIIILLFARIGLVYKPLFPIYYETHGNIQWVSELQAEALDIPVVFENSYRNSPMYAFYSGKTSFSLNNIRYRQNQYTIDDSESKVQHKKILYVSRFIPERNLIFKRVDSSEFYGKYIDDFESFRKLICSIDAESILYNTNQNHLLKVYNPYTIDIDLKKLKFNVVYLNDYKQFGEIKPMPLKAVDSTLLILKSKDTTFFNFRLPKTTIENPAYFKISISENGLPSGINSTSIKFD